jgi:protein SCO1/2
MDAAFDRRPSRSVETIMSRFRFLLLAIAGLALGVLIALGAKQIQDTGALFGSRSFETTELVPAEPAPAFTLTGANGARVGLDDFPDKVVALYGGYTFCPDVCPATLAALAAAKRELGRLGEQLQVIMITADPERDSAQVLADYVTRFDQDFIGLTGSPEELAAVYQPYGIYVQKNEGSTESAYLVDHTASVIVIDKQGAWRLLISFGTDVKTIEHDLRMLIRES